MASAAGSPPGRLDGRMDHLRLEDLQQGETFYWLRLFGCVQLALFLRHIELDLRLRHQLLLNGYFTLQMFRSFHTIILEMILGKVKITRVMKELVGFLLLLRTMSETLSHRNRRFIVKGAEGENLHSCSTL